MLQVEIRVKGIIDEHWSEWFEGLTIANPERDDTVLRGSLADQATLYGLLARLWSLGLPLRSVVVEESSIDD